MLSVHAISILVHNCSVLSNEIYSEGILFSIEIFLNKLKAKAVLPIHVRPPIVTRVPSTSPPRIPSRLSKPVDNPIRWSGVASCILFTELYIVSFISFM